ncbi:hypothetical protein QBZ16_002674 [Prototheca wickerhamii]|uniref:Core domain-containing protein n=1 Tax=Prototheca wickerhamii TaxID=3111 RepID=A0AAD9IKR5_PROWI|nr:hypothetical protein QBZ16_002674 [Prototheca wickerhamii]
MRERKGEGLLLRMGVKSGGTMEFEEEGNVGPKDTVMEYDDGFRLVCDAKSLVYLFGMSLDYSDELIGGGFKFRNPNAERSCGCGKSFKAGA